MLSKKKLDDQPQISTELNTTIGQIIATIAESFYYVNNELSIIMSNNLSNENINTGVSRETIFQKQFILALSFTVCLEDNWNTSVYVFIIEMIWLIFDVIVIDDP